MVEWPAWLSPLLRVGLAAPVGTLIVTAAVAFTPDAWLDDRTRDARAPVRPYFLLGFVVSGAWAAVKAAPLGWDWVKANAARGVEARDREAAVDRLPAGALAILDQFDRAKGLPLPLDPRGQNVELLLAEGLIRHAGSRPLTPFAFALFRPAPGVLDALRRVRRCPPAGKPPPHE